ncbi:hypothetical protein BH23GEM3_BH23GEM3_06170 [soil metagenome]
MTSPECYPPAESGDSDGAARSIRSASRLARLARSSASSGSSTFAMYSAAPRACSLANSASSSAHSRAACASRASPSAMSRAVCSVWATANAASAARPAPTESGLAFRRFARVRPGDLRGEGGVRGSGSFGCGRDNRPRAVASGSARRLSVVVQYMGTRNISAIAATTDVFPNTTLPSHYGSFAHSGVCGVCRGTRSLEEHSRYRPSGWRTDRSAITLDLQMAALFS